MEDKKNSLFSFLKDFYKKNSFKISPLPGDGSLRQFFRVSEEKSSKVLMYWKDLTKKEALNFLNLHNRFLEQNIKIPKIYHFSLDQSYFLFEDLSDLKLETKAKALLLEIKSKDLKKKDLASKKLIFFYKKAIEELTKIHSLFLEERKTQDPTINKNELSFKKDFSLNIKYKDHFSKSLNQEKLLQEINFTLLHFIEKISQIKLSTVEEKKLKSIFIDICYKLDQKEKRISHRDYHSKNLMIKDQNIRVIDYQDALLAPVQYDLSSLLFDPYTHLPFSLVEELLEYYFETSKEYKFQTVHKEKFLNFLLLQSIQRNFKAIGSFASFYNLKNDASYLKYIPQALERILHHLKYFREYKDFGLFIQDHNLIGNFSNKK